SLLGISIEEGENIKYKIRLRGGRVYIDRSEIVQQSMEGVEDEEIDMKAAQMENYDKSGNENIRPNSSSIDQQGLLTSATSQSAGMFTNTFSSSASSQYQQMLQQQQQLSTLQSGLTNKRTSQMKEGSKTQQQDPNQAQLQGQQQQQAQSGQTSQIFPPDANPAQLLQQETKSVILRRKQRKSTLQIKNQQSGRDDRQSIGTYSSKVKDGSYKQKQQLLQQQLEQEQEEEEKNEEWSGRLLDTLECGEMNGEQFGGVFDK
ncbi:MAG: hypothetical protein EZS28_053520, partial [Streblomastix strix]